MTNPLGCATLFVREVRRFFNVKVQTILAPALTAWLYLIVFHYALGSRNVAGFDVDYFTFLAPGLAMMSLLQNAFANTSSSLVTSRVMGVHVYLLMAPLSALEVVLALLGAAVVRGLIVAGVFLLALWPFASLALAHPWAILFFACAGGVIMGALGLIAGLWARRFDDMALVTNFVVMPLTFLSGAFYSTAQLPSWWQALNAVNPVFYLIDGFRYGLLGASDASVATGVLVCSALALGLCVLCWWLWRIGWRWKE